MGIGCLSYCLMVVSSDENGVVLGICLFKSIVELMNVILRYGVVGLRDDVFVMLIG